MDIATMLERIEQNRRNPLAPHDPRPALVAAAKAEAVDAEFVLQPSSKAKPVRTPVPATHSPQEFVRELERRRAEGPLPD
jgi:hypothetical protein